MSSIRAESDLTCSLPPDPLRLIRQGLGFMPEMIQIVTKGGDGYVSDTLYNFQH